jgi:hypothetical protein
VLVLDLRGHRGLLGHLLDQLGVQQLVFALVMVVQRREREIDVIGQKRDPVRRRCRSLAHELRRLLIHATEGAVDDRHVPHVDRLRHRHFA